MTLTYFYSRTVQFRSFFIFPCYCNISFLLKKINNQPIVKKLMPQFATQVYLIGSTGSQLSTNFSNIYVKFSYFIQDSMFQFYRFFVTSCGCYKSCQRKNTLTRLLLENRVNIWNEYRCSIQIAATR